jgi:alternate signal-mediated exported protein
MKKSEAKKKKKKMMLVATLATAAVIVGGLTFAWYTSQDSVTNTFQTAGNLKTVVVENFTPPTNWQPGVTTDKVVQVTNTGTVDAYTRVRLDEILQYYAKKGTETDVKSASTNDFAYFTVDAEAIEKTVTAWNNDTANEKQKYVLLQDSDLKALAAGLDTKKVVIYVKQSTANSKETDSYVTETGVNYDFIGYYDTGKTIDNENNVLNSTASGKKLAYELNIKPTIVDNQTVKTDATSGKTSITHDYTSSTLAVTLYDAELKVIKNNSSTKDEENISTYIQLEFNPESNWYFSDGYYYYQKVLASGGSTTPLLKAVRFKDDVGNEIANAVYQLTVISDSTQAVEDAATATWNLGTGNIAKFATIFGSSATTNIVASNPASDKACKYSKNNGTVCSDDPALVAVIGSDRKHDDTLNVKMPTANTTTTTTEAESGESAESTESTSAQD